MSYTIPYHPHVGQKTRGVNSEHLFTPRTDDLYDLYELYDLYDLYELYDLYDLYDLFPLQFMI